MALEDHPNMMLLLQAGNRGVEILSRLLSAVVLTTLTTIAQVFDCVASTLPAVRNAIMTLLDVARYYLSLIHI